MSNPSARATRQRWDPTGWSRRLGAGGHGVVYLGQARNGTPVAVKVLREGLTVDDRVDDRLAAAIAAARTVEPFCLARVLDASTSGRAYIVAEYVDGPSLQQAGRRGGAELQRLAVATATALDAIHQAGVVHGDLTPSNVLLGPDGAKVVDFGIAAALGSGMKATSNIVGTPAYMAPEQLAGRPVGAAADVFSWASVLVFAATGVPPFGDDALPAVINRILREEPQLGELGRPLRDIVAACLVKDPGARPSMRDVLLELTAPSRRTLAPHAAPPTPTTRRTGRGVPPMPRRRPAEATTRDFGPTQDPASGDPHARTGAAHGSEAPGVAAGHSHDGRPSYDAHLHDYDVRPGARPHDPHGDGHPRDAHGGAHPHDPRGRARPHDAHSDVWGDVWGDVRGDVRGRDEHQRPEQGEHDVSGQNGQTAASLQALFDMSSTVEPSSGERERHGSGMALGAPVAFDAPPASRTADGHTSAGGPGGTGASGFGSGVAGARSGFEDRAAGLGAAEAGHGGSASGRGAAEAGHGGSASGRGAAEAGHGAAADGHGAAADGFGAIAGGFGGAGGFGSSGGDGGIGGAEGGGQAAAGGQESGKGAGKAGKPSRRRRVKTVAVAGVSGVSVCALAGAIVWLTPTEPTPKTGEVPASSGTPTAPAATPSATAPATAPADSSSDQARSRRPTPQSDGTATTVPADDRTTSTTSGANRLRLVYVRPGGTRSGDCWSGGQVTLQALVRRSGTATTFTYAWLVDGTSIARSSAVISANGERYLAAPRTLRSTGGVHRVTLRITTPVTVERTISVPMCEQGTY
ncbi:protein kinase domain-containing protein [Nonomuraea salmonea]|uniref:protein kinase domain-containing protein n=1 Tax=Nonomuraea salmonea TaxID=46181 RepID=UPI002FEB6088